MTLTDSFRVKEYSSAYLQLGSTSHTCNTDSTMMETLLIKLALMHHTAIIGTFGTKCSLERPHACTCIVPFYYVQTMECIMQGLTDIMMTDGIGPTYRAIY